MPFYASPGTRYFPAEGVRVWGARTLAADASQWRYLNVRRLFSMLKESIGDGTRWIVFEPNDQLLWRSIRRDIGAFLTRVWRDGALMGRTPQDAMSQELAIETLVLAHEGLQRETGDGGRAHA